MKPDGTQDGAPRPRPARALLLRVRSVRPALAALQRRRQSRIASSASSTASIITATAGRGVDNNWLAGNHPLAPPCDELHRGAHTQLMRYYGAAYPAEYQGNLFLDNWGAHGFAGPNRGIFRFVPDERNNIVKKEPLVCLHRPALPPAATSSSIRTATCSIADWYGRDDESDMTGRIWRLKYVGQGPAGGQAQARFGRSGRMTTTRSSALGSPHHLIRDEGDARTVERAAKRVVEKLSEHAADCQGTAGRGQCAVDAAAHRTRPTRRWPSSPGPSTPIGGCAAWPSTCCAAIKAAAGCGGRAKHLRPATRIPRFASQAALALSDAAGDSRMR